MLYPLSSSLFRAYGPAFASENKGETVALRSPGEIGHDPGGGCEFCDKDKDGGLVFIKSFKTGSTTLATYIAQVRRHSLSVIACSRSTNGTPPMR